jgi:hypothetical protein
MCRNDLQSLPTTYHIDIDGAARLMTTEAEIDQPKFSQLARRQHTVAVCAVTP